MQRILIPVDFSTSSRAAIDYALEIYSPDKYTYVLLHAFGSSRTNEFLISIDDIIESDIEKKLELERDHIIRVSGDDQIKVELKWEKCEIIEAIERLIEHIPIKLVVIGSENGISWSGDSNLNNVKTMNFVKEISLPLLIVPVNGRLRNPKDVLFATRLNGIKDQEDVAPLIDLVRNCLSRLDIINVGTDKQEGHEINKKLERTVDGFFENLPIEMHALESREVFKSIVEFTEEHHSDLVCILYRKHNLLERVLRESVSEQIMADLRWPLLTLKHQE
ncbi:MAG TPA: hypothetical protein DCX54_13135 [Flavobacteriales bacterium]|nr:hypothetical protein [Flavobacteriales bacterium]